MVATVPSLHADVDEILPGLVADRRFLHQHPELGFQEHETARFVAERLRALGVEDVRTGVAQTGVTGLIRGTAGAGAKVVALRADMDALPILEENDVDYCSRHDGVMHACGHDSHVTMLLGTARMLSEMRDRFAGTVKLIFQPGEEGHGGAKAMIAAGALEDPKPDAIFGLHVWQDFDLGVVAARPGTAMVGADSFSVVILGQGGHGALPHRCIDPIAVGAQIVVALQMIVGREIDPTLPGVVTVGSFQAGKASNVIPDTARLSGTIRTVAEGQRDEMRARVREIAEGVAATMRARAEVEFDENSSAPPVINDPDLTEIVKAAAAEVVGPAGSIDGPLMVVSEDMAEFLNRVPGCFFFVGSRNAERGLTWGHHHPRFDIDEAALATGVETMTRVVLRYLGEE